jgi:hypothetical protein
MEAERYKIKIIGHTKIDNHTEYIISIEKNGTKFSFSERYKNLKALDDLMRKYTNNNGFPKFPPKKFFGSEDEKFIIKRQNEINNYFEVISNHPEFSSLPPLLKFIEEKKEKAEISKKDETKNASITQPKKEVEIKPEKEMKKSLKKSDDDYNKIMNDYISQFYDMNSYYDKDMISDNKGYVKFFNNNKLMNGNENNKSIEPGNESNFVLISKSDTGADELEKEIREKIEKMASLNKTLGNNYDTKEIIVSI